MNKLTGREKTLRIIGYMGAVILVILIIFTLFTSWTSGTTLSQQNDSAKSVIATSTDVLPTREQLCQSMDFTKPLDQETKHYEEISQDDFIKYLRRSIDDFVNKKYEKGDQCSYPGLYRGIHCEDSAYNSETGPALFTENSDVLSGKLLVLQTDSAPGGGMSVVFLFKNNPSKIYYAWIYGEESGYYDLRGLDEHSQEEGGPTITEVQRVFINQICNDEIGI